MPPKNSITRKARISYLVYSHAIDENPGATHEYISSWVSTRDEKWLETLGWKAPSESRARDYIRKILSARTWMDSEWHLGAFAANHAHASDISPDSIPDVLTVALRAFAGGKRLTIRQAWWVSRLRKLVPSIASGTDLEIENVYSLAVSQAANELASAALSVVVGVPGLHTPQAADSDTWSLDVLLSLENSTLLPEPGFYEVLQEANFIGEPIWPEKIRMETNPTSEEVLPLQTLLLNAVPSLIGSCKAMTSALLWLRAYAEQRVEYGSQLVESAFEEITKPVQVWMATRSAPEWGSLSDDLKLAKAKEIGIRALVGIEVTKVTKEQ